MARVPEIISQKMSLKQDEKSLSSFFANKNLAKNEEKPCLTWFNPFLHGTSKARNPGFGYPIRHWYFFFQKIVSLYFRFPFYYEVKILFLIWLISPVSKGSLGSSILYRRFVHPTLINREEEIDQMILKLQEQGYNTVTKLAVKAFNNVSNIVMQTAIRVSQFHEKKNLKIMLCCILLWMMYYFSLTKNKSQLFRE